METLYRIYEHGMNALSVVEGTNNMLGVLMLQLPSLTPLVWPVAIEPYKIVSYVNRKSGICHGRDACSERNMLNGKVPKCLKQVSSTQRERCSNY